MPETCPGSGTLDHNSLHLRSPYDAELSNLNLLQIRHAHCLKTEFRSKRPCAQSTFRSKQQGEWGPNKYNVHQQVAKPCSCRYSHSKACYFLPPFSPSSVQGQQVSDLLLSLTSISPGACPNANSASWILCIILSLQHIKACLNRRIC